MNRTDLNCVVCGEPADDACLKCGQWFCAHHRGEPSVEGEEKPLVCWNCSQAGNAKAVLFWVALAVAGFVAIIIFFSLWA